MTTVERLTEEEATRRLRDAGLRVTRQRVATLQALDEHPHATVEELVSALTPRLPKVSFQAVYLVVGDLVRAGLATRLDLPGQPSRYEPNRHDNHHHVVCTVCGRLEDVPCAVGEAPCLEPSHAHDMQILVADVLYRGVCRSCRESSAD